MPTRMALAGKMIRLASQKLPRAYIMKPSLFRCSPGSASIAKERLLEECRTPGRLIEAQRNTD